MCRFHRANFSSFWGAFALILTLTTGLGGCGEETSARRGQLEECAPILALASKAGVLKSGVNQAELFELGGVKAVGCIETLDELAFGDPCPRTVDPGTTCGGDSLTCSPALLCTCGNGQIDPGEQCDGGPDCDEATCELICETDDQCTNVIACHAASTCDPSTKRCVPGGQAEEGTSCGFAGTCDALGNCLDCSLRGASCNLDGESGLGVVQCRGGSGVCEEFDPSQFQSRGECGDGYVDEDLGEVCDDNNTYDGDGCSADCREIECIPEAVTTPELQDRVVLQKTDDGACYWRTVNHIVHRDEAKAMCRQFGGHLIRWSGNVERTNELTRKLIQLNKSNTTSRVWVGISWSVEERNWLWEDGNPVASADLHWMVIDNESKPVDIPTTQPDDSGNRAEACIEWGGGGFPAFLTTTSSPYADFRRSNALDDVSCGAKRDYVCERRPAGFRTDSSEF